MFDPHSLSYRNRRIQKQAQILRSKGTTFIPQKTYGPNDFKEMQRILIANKIPAYVEPGFKLPILIDGISTDGSTVNIPLSLFKYTATEIPTSMQCYMFFHMDGEIIDFVGGIASRRTIPANSYYYEQIPTIMDYVFHSPNLGYFCSVDIQSGDNTAQVSFNTDIFQLTGLPESN